MVQARPSLSTALTLAVDADVGKAGQTVPVDRQQEFVALGLQIARHIVDREPIGQDGALHLDDVGPVTRRAPVGGALGHLAEHDGKHRSADTGGRVDRELPVADPPTHGHTHGRVVLGEVTGGDESVVGGHVGDQGPADLTDGHHGRAVAGDEVEHLGERMVGADVACLQGRAVGARDDRERLRVEAEEGLRGVPEIGRGGGADRVARSAGGGTGRDDIGPAREAALLDGLLACGQGARCGDRAVAAVHRHAAAVGEGHLGDTASEAVGIQAATGHLDVAVDDDRFLALAPDRDEGARPEGDDPRLATHRGERGGDRHVHGVAARARDRAPGGQ